MIAHYQINSRRIGCILLFFLLLVQNIIRVYAIDIIIDSQQQFDNINLFIKKNTQNESKDIRIIINPGTYYFKEGHLRLANLQHPDVSISIEGRDAVLIADGSDYSGGMAYTGGFNPKSTFVDTQTLEAYDYWHDCTYADGLVEIADESSLLCRLPNADSACRPEEECQHLYITIPQWFKSFTYKVVKIEDGNIYFTADKLECIHRGQRESYSLNYDYLYAGAERVRFVLCDPTDSSMPMQITDRVVTTRSNIHECRANQFLGLSNVSLKRFSLTGIRFLGNADNNRRLINISNTVTEDLTIADCSFEHIQSRILITSATPNVTFTRCTVSHCNSHGLESTNSCENTTVTDNTFEECGTNMQQTFCVNCKGKDYYVARNRFTNFGYSAIGLGVWHGHEKSCESSGIVEHNIICYTPEYLANKERHTLMDSGAIYLWTQNDDAVVRYNYIHDYGGMAYNQGIYCDDGASHFKLIGNIVINITEDRSIDARTCQSQFPDSNQDIQMMYNIVDRPIKFEGNTRADNGCIKSNNVMLHDTWDEVPSNIYKNLNTKQQDLQLTYEGWNDNGVIVNGKSKEALKRLPCYDSIKQFIQ